MVFAQSVSNLSEQGVVGHCRKIVKFNRLRRSLATRSTDQNKRSACAPCPRRQSCFYTHLVAGVDHHVDPIRAEGFPVLWRNEVVYGVDATGRMNLGNPGAHGFHFGLPDRAVERMHLTIDVGFGNMVQVHQTDTAHTGSGQSFCSP